MFKRIQLCSLLLVLCALGTSNLEACTKPVFRYALENWRASPYRGDIYRLAVLHKGPLDDETTKRLSATMPEGSFNLFVEYFDVNKELPEGVLRDRWLADPDPSRLPLALFRTPAEVQTESPILWEGKFDTAGAETLRKQIYSPVMRQLLQKLASGDTAVWIFAKCPDEAKNKETRRLLDKSLAELEEELKLPHEQNPLDSEYDVGLAPGIPMRMSFSVVETNLDDPANRLLKAFLMVMDEESLKQAGPKIIPVFGRCRGLGILYEDYINAEEFESIAYFLVGPCSCRVKEANPGFDLPAPFPWDSILFEETELDAVMKQLPDAPVKRGSDVHGDAK